MFRVLFVDDDAAMRLLMKRVLSFDYQVEVADCGEAAARLVEAADEPFAVVLADMSMDRGDGLQLMSYVRRMSPDTARILFSGDYNLSLDPSFSQTAGLFRLLTKPADNSTILNAVRAGVNHFASFSAVMAA